MVYLYFECLLLLAGSLGVNRNIDWRDELSMKSPQTSPDLLLTCTHVATSLIKETVQKITVRLRKMTESTNPTTRENPALGGSRVGSSRSSWPSRVVVEVEAVDVTVIL